MADLAGTYGNFGQQLAAAAAASNTGTPLAEQGLQQSVAGLYGQQATALGYQNQVQGALMPQIMQSIAGGGPSTDFSKYIPKAQAGPLALNSQPAPTEPIPGSPTTQTGTTPEATTAAGLGGQTSTQEAIPGTNSGTPNHIPAEQPQPQGTITASGQEAPKPVVTDKKPKTADQQYQEGFGTMAQNNYQAVQTDMPPEVAATYAHLKFIAGTNPYLQAQAENYKMQWDQFVGRTNQSRLIEANRVYTASRDVYNASQEGQGLKTLQRLEPDVYQQLLKSNPDMTEAQVGQIAAGMAGATQMYTGRGTEIGKDNYIYDAQDHSRIPGLNNRIDLSPQEQETRLQWYRDPVTIQTTTGPANVQRWYAISHLPGGDKNWTGPQDGAKDDDIYLGKTGDHKTYGQYGSPNDALNPSPPPSGATPPPSPGIPPATAPAASKASPGASKPAAQAAALKTAQQPPPPPPPSAIATPAPQAGATTAPIPGTPPLMGAQVRNLQADQAAQAANQLASDRVLATQDPKVINPLNPRAGALLKAQAAARVAAADAAVPPSTSTAPPPPTSTTAKAIPPPSFQQIQRGPNAGEYTSPNAPDGVLPSVPDIYKQVKIPYQFGVGIDPNSDAAKRRDLQNTNAPDAVAAEQQRQRSASVGIEQDDLAMAQLNGGAATGTLTEGARSLQKGLATLTGLIVKNNAGATQADAVNILSDPNKRAAYIAQTAKILGDPNAGDILTKVLGNISIAGFDQMLQQAGGGSTRFGAQLSDLARNKLSASTEMLPDAIRTLIRYDKANRLYDRQMGGPDFQNYQSGGGSPMYYQSWYASAAKREDNVPRIMAQLDPKTGQYPNVNEQGMQLHSRPGSQPVYLSNDKSQFEYVN